MVVPHHAGFYRKENDNMQTIRTHLRDNRGDENISKLIWVCIVFVVGAILLALITSAFKGPIANWYTNTVKHWFTDANGNYNFDNSTVTVS